MYDLFLTCRNSFVKGAFNMCEKGEMDMRGCYIAVVISKLLNI